MDASLRTRLLGVLGTGGVADGDAVLPATAEHVSAVCRLCAETHTAMTVISGPDSAELAVVRGMLVSLARMTNLSIDAGAQIAHAQAGVMLPALSSSARQQGLTTMGFGGGHPEHVGSAIARGAIPPRALLGIDLVLSDGTRLTAGGRTLKDVTGYDLPGMMLGSMGRLAIIVGASFRLAPERAALPLARPAGVARSNATFAALCGAMDPAGQLQPAD